MNIQRACLTAIVASMVCACARFERAQSCRVLARTLNPALAEIELIERDPEAGSAGYRRAARRYSQLSGEISRIHVHEDELATEVRQYRESIVRASELVRQAAELTEQQSNPKLEGVRRELSGLDQRHRQHTRRIEALCRGGRPN